MPPLLFSLKVWWKLGLERTSVWELTLGPWLSHEAKSFQAADAAGNKMFLALAVCGHHPRSSKVHRCLGLTPRFWYNFLGIWIWSFPDDFDVQLNWEPLLAASHSEVIPTCRGRLALKSLQGAEQNPNTAIPAEHASYFAPTVLRGSRLRYTGWWAGGAANLSSWMKNKDSSAPSTKYTWCYMSGTFVIFNPI